ncbi:hypothetical protein CVT25_002960 [Psilocybe cyanescens]|uniref:DH domain-containing protein n=1 Tax=Psilocybe cyanescens TaxID=93625 RepID=A0A409WN25_PSICY|nr:hypothetical protein CVT25_002960 [Psilocybe cyanescens]
MLWSFKRFINFTLNAVRTRVQSPLITQAHNESEHPPEEFVFYPPKIKVTKPESEQIASQLCQCGYQRLEFCPYCEYDQSVQVEGSISLENGPSSPDIDGPLNYAQMDGSDGPSRPRKLRKIKSDYPRTQHEILDQEVVIAARPNSILSNHSRTPLLNNGLQPKSNYLPLSPEQRTPKKLEKRGRRQRSDSLPSPSMLYSTFSDISDDGQLFNAMTVSKSKSLRSFGPRPDPISKSIETDALVALAWTGQTSPSSSHFTTPSSDGSVSPSYFGSGSFLLSPTDQISSCSPIISHPSTAGTPNEKHRSVLRKQKDPNDPKFIPSRPWTLAMVITDDGITDERLVNDLEHMRIKDTTVDASIIPDRYPLAQGFPPDYHTQLYDSLAEYPLQSGEMIPDPIPPSDSSWTSARHALLLCRELVRTERRYLASLKILITNGTNTPPPPQMLPYLPCLISVSDSMLTLMQENPSVQGVSQAFLTCKDQLGEAFVSWCSVVGHFFDSDDGVKHKSSSEETTDTHPKHIHPAASLRGLSTESILPIVVTEPNKIRKNSKARPSVRDLAILPTQRIMRYVLIFKELHALTPASYSSFSFVEFAVQAAELIAQSADMAQGHTAFVQSTH